MATARQHTLKAIELSPNEHRCKGKSVLPG